MKRIMEIMKTIMEITNASMGKIMVTKWETGMWTAGKWLGLDAVTRAGKGTARAAGKAASDRTEIDGLTGPGIPGKAATLSRRGGWGN
ncbi:MAG: hypothetical protein GKC10_06690 [Methanosarcinales archaeon]|nr:hypothetical protein [Methanosarcinales archaeon]